MTSQPRVIKDLLWAVALAGMVGGLFRLWFGLGATTNLSDAVPWGLWKVLNMVGGVALSTSGFTVGFLVYVLRLERFRPFMKPAILIAFLGYGCSCLALLFDIGLPHRFWHPIFMWNINSFLFEVFWCVMLYFTVTAIELAPTIFEKFRAEKISRILHRVAFAVVVIGISLSTLHHSSLGSLFLVTPIRLHPLWYTPWLPLLFILSAMGGGLMVVVLAKILWARWYDPAPVFGNAGHRRISITNVLNGNASGLFSRESEGVAMPPIRELATIAASILGIFLVVKLGTQFLTGDWRLLVAGTWESWLFLLELLLAVIIPILLISIPQTRFSPTGIGLAAFSATCGLALNRLDVGIFGYFRDAGVIYFPSLVEWSVGLGVVAAAGLVFFFMGEHFPIFSDLSPRTPVTVGQLRLSLGSLRQLWHTVLTNGLQRVSLLAVFIIPAAFALMYPAYCGGGIDEQYVRPASGVDAERTVLRIDGDHQGVETVFAHADHQKRLGDSASCSKCHHISLPNDRSTPCSRCHRQMNEPTEIFDHGLHQTAVARAEHLTGWHPANKSCSFCHPAAQPETAHNAKDCMQCHREDMFVSTVPVDSLDLVLANSFREAMHRNCIECHDKEAVNQNRPHLADCRSCHRSLRARSQGTAGIASISLE